MSVAAAPAPRLLREIEPFKDDKPKVTRPRAERDRQLQASEAPDPHAIVEELVLGALDRGALGLCDVTRQVSSETVSELLFVTAGRVAQAVARFARTSHDRDRPWLSVHDGLVIEEWNIAKGGARD